MEKKNEDFRRACRISYDVRSRNLGIEGKARIGESTKKYIKWVLGLDRNTPNYVVEEETGTEKLLIITVRRAKRYEEKLRKQEKGSILGECWKIQERKKTEKSQEDKRRLLEERG